jgi:hypothetical protein
MSTATRSSTRRRRGRGRHRRERLPVQTPAEQVIAALRRNHCRYSNDVLDEWLTSDNAALVVDGAPVSPLAWLADARPLQTVIDAAEATTS